MTEILQLPQKEIAWLKSLGPKTAALVDDAIAEGRFVVEQSGVCENGSKN